MTRDEGVVPGRPDLGGGLATPSFRLPAGSSSGLPAGPAPLRIGERMLVWGQQTYVMGILNVTPDSFSGDGLLATGRTGGSDEGWIDAAVARARAMAADGADLLDV